MEQTIIGVLFVAAIAAAIAAIFDAVKQRAEKAATDKRNEELESQLVASENKRQDLEKLLHSYSSLKPNAVNPQGVQYHSAAPRIADGVDPDHFGF
jgi:carbonic anhydrase